MTKFIELMSRYAIDATQGEGFIENQYNPYQLSLAMQYVEESLAKYLQQSSMRLDSVKSISDYNQLRYITSVFIRFPTLDVSAFSNRETVNIANDALTVCLTATKKHGGCCRQFGCDDKAATVLLIWGMEGYAHERGEAVHAVAASLEIAKGLEPIFGTGFSIGVAAGSV